MASVHSKTRRRVRIVLTVGLLLCLLAGGGYVLRKKQLAARVLRDRDSGYAALAAGEYYTALHKIGPFVQTHPNDAEALFKYASARQNVEEPNAKHLIDAMGLYRRLLEIAPDHAEGRAQLLDLYVGVGFNSEIMSMTQGHEDSASLRARAIASARLGQTQPAMELLNRYLALKPADLEMQITACELLKAAGSSAEQILANPTALQQAHPEDPAFELLLASAFRATDNREQSLQWASRAAARTLQDPVQVKVAMALLDSLQKSDEATRVLIQAAQAKGDIKFGRMMMARLYQSRKYTQVLEHLADLEKQPEKADAELLFHLALTYQAMERFEDAERIVQLLSSRKADFKATSAAAVLSALPKKDQVPDDQRIIIACRDGVRSESDNPYFHLYLGDAYSRIGEIESALGEWTQAANHASVWAVPLSRLLRVSMAAGQGNAPRLLSDRAEQLAADDPEILGLVAAARTWAADAKDPAAAAPLLGLIERVQQLKPGEPNTLAARIQLLATTRGIAEAKESLEALLRGDPPLSTAAYVALARCSEANHLQMEEACFNRCLAARGMSCELASAQADWVLRSGRGSDAVKYFETSRAGAADRENLQWQLGNGRLLDQAGDERAAKYWAQLADAQPDTAVIQAELIRLRSTQNERELIRRAVDRLQKLMGDEGVAWRLADARWIMQGALLQDAAVEREREIVKAAALLSDMVRRYPDQLQSRLLLSECMLRLNKKPEAVEQLIAATRLAPRLLSPLIQLASLLQSMGDFERAGPYLQQAEKLLEPESSPSTAPILANEKQAGSDALLEARELSADAARRTLASLYSARGDNEHAMQIIRQLQRPAATEVDLGIAGILAWRGELTAEACQQLLKTPSLTAIEVVAENYARQGRSADAAATLAMLEGITAKPGEKELLRGLHYQRRGEYVQAAEQLKIVCKEMPSSNKAWREYIRALLLQGKADEAVAAAAQASSAIAEEPTFKRIVQQKQLVHEFSTTALPKGLMVALLDNAGDPDVLISALKVVHGGAVGGKTIQQVALELRPLAERAPGLAALQYLLIDMYMAMGNVDEAVALATRLMQFLPADALPAARAATALAAAGRWNEVVPVAQQWRSRLGAATLPADQLLAAAYASLGRFDDAIRQLDPHLERAKANPAQGSEVLATYAQALIGQGKIDDAAALLRPFLASQRSLRVIWMQMALRQLRDNNASVRWLQQVAEVTPSDAVAEQLLLANAWSQLALRTARPADTQSADAQMRKLTQLMESNAATQPTQPAEPVAGMQARQWFDLGILKEQRGDAAGAEAAYRNALRADPQQSVAKNNLAMLIVRRNGDLSEALRLSGEAAADEKSPARHEFLDTLGQIQSKSGQFDAAEQSLRQALQLQPRALQIRANLVKLLIDAGKTKEASGELDELKRMAAMLSPPDQPLNARIEAMVAAIGQSPPAK